MNFMVIPNVHTVHLHLTKSDLNLILQIKDQLKSHEGKQQVSVITLYIMCCMLLGKATD